MSAHVRPGVGGVDARGLDIFGVNFRACPFLVDSFPHHSVTDVLLVYSVLFLVHPMLANCGGRGPLGIRLMTGCLSPFFASQAQELDRSHVCRACITSVYSPRRGWLYAQHIMLRSLHTTNTCNSILPPSRTGYPPNLWLCRIAPTVASLLLGASQIAHRRGLQHHALQGVTWAALHHSPCSLNSP